MNGRIAIPRAHREALVFLAKLPRETFKSLCTALESLPSTLQREEMLLRVQEVLPAEDAGQADSLISAILGAATLKGRGRLESKQLAETVAAEEALPLEAATREILAERLLRLLQIGAVAKVAKALDMLLEHERVFHAARVLTDMRPVFPDDASEGPVGAVILHLLKIDVHVASDNTEFYVSLDSSDLQQLRKVLDRAIDKERELRKFLAGTGLPLLEVGQE